jgi:hypothetical protein
MTLPVRKTPSIREFLPFSLSSPSKELFFSIKSDYHFIISMNF